MKSLVFDALAEAAGRLNFPDGWLVNPLGVDALVQFDALVGSAEFAECNLDGLDFSQEPAAEEYLLSAGSVSAKNLLDAAVVQPDFYNYC